MFLGSMKRFHPDERINRKYIIHMKNFAIFFGFFLFISCSKDDESVAGAKPAFEAEFNNELFAIESGSAYYKINNTAIEFTFKGVDKIDGCYDPSAIDSLMFLIVPSGDVVGTHPLRSYSQQHIPFKLSFEWSKDPDFNRRIVIEEFDRSTGFIKGSFLKEDLGYINECSGESVDIGQGVARFECFLE